MKAGALIGKGLTAEVYEWGKDKVLKLYYESFGDDWIKNEVQIGHTIHDAGVSSPDVFGIVNVEGRKGAIFQRIFGKSMLKHVEEEPWKSEYFARQMAGMHYEMHKCSAKRLPSQKDRLVSGIKESSKLLGDKGKRIIAYIESLPDGKSVCHGDLHFDNIIVSDHGLITIDWTNAFKGDPLGDVARTCLNISSPTIPPGAFNITAIPYMYGKWLTYWAYLNEYMRLSKTRFENIDAWILPVATAKLKEGIPGEEMWLMYIINKYLEQLNI